MRRQEPFKGREVARFAGWFWRGFYAMGCNLFGATLIFPFNAMTDGGFCSMIWQVFSRLLTMRLGTNASRVK
jgi:hypothetical protein